jgi:hypothetical protein
MIFDTSKSRKEVIEISDSLAKYLHKEEIDNIFLLDRSARPAYLGLIHSWRNIYPNEKRPNIYFTNPDGYTTRNSEDIIKEFKEIYKKLPEEKNTKIMIFDTCIHTGNTMRPVRDILKEMSYENIILGAIRSEDEYEPYLNLEFQALDYNPDQGCYPFSRDNLIYKNNNSILSKREKYCSFKRAINIRKEISQIFKDAK